MNHLTEIIPLLLAWYDKQKRDLPWRQEVTPYRVWISEIMLQQTRVEAVKGYFARFLRALPTVQALAEVPEQQLLKLWEGLGYYNRARNLQRAAQDIMERFGGTLPNSYEQLLTLAGIGSYTAGAIASIAFQIPVPAVDGNVLRVLARLTADRADIADPRTKKVAEQMLLQIMPQQRPGDFNQALMELGATVCVPNGAPSCLCCPVRQLCEGYRQGIMLELPVKSAKKPRKIEQRTVLVLLRDGKLALRRREKKGLLAGLWELPNFEGCCNNAQAVAAVRSLGLEPLRAEPLMAAKHIFTHIEWHMTGWRVTVEDACEVAGLVWVNPTQLQTDYPLPSAFSAFLPGRMT
ncbi:MAG: A/G-specific adenine glycosylase [Anaerotruncus sp.]|nr:A/G-specific adenine glycosylase [Anaerotruncus sp.]